MPLISEPMPLPLDCLAWHTPSLLLVGAYQLQNQTRIGRLYLLHLTADIPGGFTVTSEIDPPGGVLDLKIEGNTAAVATSEGVAFYSIKDKELFFVNQIKTPSMILYIEFIPSQILFSDSEGCVGLIENYAIVKKKKVHEALTWVTHYNKQTSTILCGADCGKFTLFYKQDLERDELMTVKRFEVGVTSISSRGDVVFVGGYSNLLHSFKITTTSKPTLTPLHQINLSGAIWRTKLITRNEELFILVACARNGVKLLRYDDGFSVLQEFNKYKGFLAYGLDFIEDQGEILVGSCYFDNHLLEVFRVE